MKTLRVIAIASAVGLTVACEGEFDPGTVAPSGVQIGSEGLLRDCDEESVQPNDAIDGLDFTPQELADQLLLDWDATLDAPSGPVTGTVSMAPATFSQLTGEADCLGVWLGVTGRATFTGSLEAELVGHVLVEREGPASFAVWSDAYTGSIEPSYDPSVVQIDRVRLTGTVTETSLAGVAEFIGCDETDCESENIGSLAATPR